MPKAINEDLADPSLSVVICTKDRPDSLARTLESIWVQTRLPEELIVVDDGVLPEQIVLEIAAACSAHNIHWKYHRKDTPGLTRSRNAAAEFATGDVLIYLDDDITCAPNLLSEIRDLMRDPRVAALSPVIHEPAFAGVSAKAFQWGYRLAGWWRVRPRVNLANAPSILGKPPRAAPLGWLSGAAMAIRRSIVVAEHFDENLSTYALGEDREMGYRLARRFHLIEARATHVVHRRDPAARIDHRRLGFMTSYNYLYILAKTCELRRRDWLLIAWSLLVVAAMHLVWGLRRLHHFSELVGMISGVISYFESIAHREHRPQMPARKKSKVQNPKSKILFVTTTLAPGGAELMLVALAPRLREHNIEPSILCLKSAGVLAAQCRQQDIAVNDSLLHHKTDVAVIGRIRDLIEQHAIDVVCVAHSGGDRMFWSTLAARSLNVPVVVWSHWFPRPGRRHLEPGNRVITRFVDIFVALGARHRDALARYEHVPASRIHVIPNALELERFAAPDRRHARKLLHLRDDQIAVGIIANLRPEKRHDVFIDAARRLHQSWPELRFFVIGDGPDRDAVLTAASASGLNHDTLRILGARSDIAQLLPGLDICCLCSEVECFSVTMLEAAACHCAFIGPDAGSIPEFIADGVNGLLIRPAHTGDLVEAIKKLARDNGYRHALARKAHQRVHEDFSMDVMAARFAELFLAVKDKPRAHRYSRPLSGNSPRVLVREAIATR